MNFWSNVKNGVAIIRNGSQNFLKLVTDYATSTFSESLWSGVFLTWDHMWLLDLTDGVRQGVFTHVCIEGMKKWSGYDEIVLLKQIVLSVCSTFASNTKLIVDKWFVGI